jgi:phospholipid/cholesterol/gamma-HCH transport system ATP-binding protein
MIKDIIKVENLCASFENQEILKHVSFKAFENEITVILGSSGCGKTTVMKHVIGLYPIQEGKISILGQSLCTGDEDERNSLLLKMGVLFQNGALLNSCTISENVSIPLQQHTNFSQDIIDNIVRIKLNSVGLLHAMNLLPSQLSGGMRKRAALARAMVLDPPLLFCDEPSAGLDPVTLESLDSLILQLKNQLRTTIVLITHEVSSIFRLADRIVFMDSGTVLYEGDLTSALESDILQMIEFFKKAKGKGS